MRSLFFLLLLVIPSVSAEETPIMTLDSLADVYYDAETGDAISSDAIKALDGKTIRIAGYMVPFNDLENLKEFMLMPSSNGCNFCEAPMKEEMIYVRQPGKKKYDYIGDPIVLTGKLWVQGAGTEAPNSTYAQFLYALQDTKVEKLKASDQALLEVVTPRTIIKQVCSLLRVRLLKQVTFEALDDSAYQEKRKELLLKYLGGAEGEQALTFFLNAFGIQNTESLSDLGSAFLTGWSAAFSDISGETIYYHKGLDLSEKKNQLQIAIACYDLLFHQEIDIHNAIHQGTPSIDEKLARLSLILGLRQSFAQFYGSIGLIDLRPLEKFAAPYDGKASLPKPFKTLAEQLLIKQGSFISELYKAEQFQPYTKAIASPPVSMTQILSPALYCEKGSTFEPQTIDGYENRLGPYLTSLILGLDTEGIVADGIHLKANEFQWSILFKSEEVALKAETLLNKKAIRIQRTDTTLELSSQ